MIPAKLKSKSIVRFPYFEYIKTLSQIHREISLRRKVYHNQKPETKKVEKPNHILLISTLYKGYIKIM